MSIDNDEEHNYTRRTSLDVFLSDLRDPSESDPIVELAIQDKKYEAMIYELRDENSKLKEQVESLKFAEIVLRKEEMKHMAEEDNLMQSIEIESLKRKLDGMNRPISTDIPDILDTLEKGNEEELPQKLREKAKTDGFISLADLSPTLLHPISEKDNSSISSPPKQLLTRRYKHTDFWEDIEDVIVDFDPIEVSDNSDEATVFDANVMNKNMKHFLLELLYTSRLILTRDGTIPVWDKKGTPFCHSCDRSFGWLTFKHHCRNCGHSFCGTCCSKYVVLRRLGNYYQERVCDMCFVIVTRICTYYRDERKPIKLVESRHVKFDKVLSPHNRRSDTPEFNGNVKGSRRESAASEQSKFSFSDDPILF